MGVRALDTQANQPNVAVAHHTAAWAQESGTVTVPPLPFIPTVEGPSCTHVQFWHPVHYKYYRPYIGQLHYKYHHQLSGRSNSTHHMSASSNRAPSRLG